MSPGDRRPRNQSDEAMADRLIGWFEVEGRLDEADLEPVRGAIRTLPVRSRRHVARRVAVAASIALAIGVVGLVLGRIPLGAVGARPPDPAAYAGDPRLASCGDVIGPVDQAFEMTRARLFPLHFPGWGRGAPELEVDDPALVVIGPRRVVPVLGAAASGDNGQRSPDASFRMCIAVGPPGDATVHDYGWTSFRRIVPVLSDTDLARAADMDPDVLADPANWPAPARLAPCGGLTDNVRYVFEIDRLRDFGRHFPSVGKRTPAAFDTDAGATIVVFQGPSRVALQPLTIYQNDLGGERRDVCVIFFEPGEAGDAVLIRDLDVTGLRVRLEDPESTPSRAAPTPPPSAPAVTPPPRPAWAADATESLQCTGEISTLGPTGAMEIGEDGSTSDAALRGFLQFAQGGSLMFPVNGFVEADRDERARLYVYVVDGRVRAAIVTTTRADRNGGPWYVSSVASCDPAEWDPSTPVGMRLTIWTDPAGARVPVSRLLEREDCYGASVLRLEGRLFLRDPSGNAVDRSQLDTTYDGDAQLPSSAERQPFRQGDRRLFVAADGRAAFVVGSSGVERWPHVRGDEIQRIDCN